MRKKIFVHYYVVAILICSLLLSNANGQAIINKTFSINLEKVKIENAIKAISTITNVKFNYSTGTINFNLTVSYNASNKRIIDFINEILIPNGINYQEVNGSIVLFSSKKNTSKKANSENIKNIVSGIVKDSSGNPLEGVTIKVKGSNLSTITDKSGHYSINTNNTDQILVFTYVGYSNIEKKIGGDNFIDISMIQVANKLDEVIVIGYGTVKKSDLTGAVVKLKPNDLGNLPISSFDQFIQGRAAGVQITQNSGEPGAGMTFLIRGASTVTGSSQPLFVIDGYPVNTDPNSSNPTTGGDGQTLGSTPPTNPLASINPNDIESIEILKDASSIAIYGSRGANGVVMITTKKAKASNDRVNYSTRIDMSSLAKEIAVLNMTDYMKYSNEASLNSGMDSIYKSTSLLNPPTSYNYQDLIYKSAITNEHNLSITGGDEKNRYLLSANYLNQQGIISNSSFMRGSFRLNLERKVNNKLKLTTNAYVTPSTTQSIQQNSYNGFSSGSVVGGALTYPPYYTPFVDDDPSQPNTSLTGNPLTLIQLEKNETKSTVLVGNIKVDYKILNDLSLLITLGANNTTATKNFFLPTGTNTGSTDNGYAYSGYSNNFNYLGEYTLNFRKTFKEKHRINAVAGYTWQDWNAKTAGVAVKNFVSQVLNFENFGLAQNATSVSNHTIWALQSFLARVTYSYDNRYIINLVGRSDGSTKLSDGHKWAFFPSIGAGWNISNEKFYPFRNIAEEAKLRASYGVSGNKNILPNASLQTLSIARSVVGGTINNGLITGNIGNQNLNWENTQQYDGGLDLSFFSGRLTASVDIYSKQTSDLLIQLSMPPSSGYASFSGNIGKLENKGIDISVSALVLPNNSKIKWQSSGNISFNKNKVIDLGGVQLFGQGFTISTSQQPINTALAGNPIGAFWGYKTDGVYQNQKEIQNGPYDSYNPQPGDIRFKDVIGNDTIDARQKTIIGSPYPKYTFGLTNSLTYKNFTFSFLITGAIGAQKVNLNRLKLDNLYAGSNSNVSQYAWVHRWTGEGTSNYYPAASSMNTNGKSGFRTVAPQSWTNFSDFLVEDASFVRLKSLMLSYAINTRLIPLIKSVNVFISATNLFIITKYTGYDPEVSANANAPLTPGIDNGTIPQPKIFSVGINVGF